MRLSLKPRQRAALAALLDRAAAAAEDDSPRTHWLHAYQLTGTATADLQLALAFTVAERHRWRTLLLQSDTLARSLEFTVRRAREIERATPTRVLNDLCRRETLPEPSVSVIPASELDSELRAESPRVRGDDFDLLIVSAMARDDLETSLALAGCFEAARLVIVWFTSHPTTAIPRPSVEAGAITLHTPPAAAAARQTTGAAQTARD
jgi:hypothetical protein